MNTCITRRHCKTRKKERVPLKTGFPLCHGCINPCTYTGWLLHQQSINRMTDKESLRLLITYWRWYCCNYMHLNDTLSPIERNEGIALPLIWNSSVFLSVALVWLVALTRLGSNFNVAFMASQDQNLATALWFILLNFWNLKMVNSHSCLFYLSLMVLIRLKSLARLISSLSMFIRHVVYAKEKNIGLLCLELTGYAVFYFTKHKCETEDGDWMCNESLLRACFR